MALFNTIQWNGSAVGNKTCSDTIYSAFRIAQMLKNAEQTAPEEWLNDGLRVLNTIIDAMNAKRGMIYGIKRNVYDMTADQQDYTIGPGAEFEHAYVEKIIRAGVIFSNVEMPVRVMTTFDRADFAYTNASSIPSGVYFEKGASYGTLSYLFKPSTNIQATLYLWEPITGFDDLASEIAMPPMYAKYLEYNLAEELALRWPSPVSNIQPDAKRIAARLRVDMAGVNSRQNQMQCSADFMQGNRNGAIGSDNEAYLSSWYGY